MQKQLGAPATLRSFFSGTMQGYEQSLTTMPILVATALIAVYIVLGILYENLIHPITIISTLPSAGVVSAISQNQPVIIEIKGLKTQPL